MNEKSLHQESIFLEKMHLGEEGAFEEIYNHYADDLIDFAARRLESLSEAKDIVQDLFLDLWIKRETLMITFSLRAYLFSAVRFKVIDHIRKNIHREYYSNIVKDLYTRDDNSTFDNILYNDMSSYIDSEVKKLPRRIREIYQLSRYQHLSISEIASQMNVSEQTVKNQLTTALKRLRPVISKILIIIALLSIH